MKLQEALKVSEVVLQLDDKAYWTRAQAKLVYNNELVIATFWKPNQKYIGASRRKKGTGRRSIYESMYNDKPVLDIRMAKAVNTPITNCQLLADAHRSDEWEPFQP